MVGCHDTPGPRPSDSGAWFVSHVQIPGSNVYVIVKADTLPGIKEAINEVLHSTRKGN